VLRGRGEKEWEGDMGREEGEKGSWIGSERGGGRYGMEEREREEEEEEAGRREAGGEDEVRWVGREGRDGWKLRTPW
jgi:hypothetical protein